jgi:hypothetical protein
MKLRKELAEKLRFAVDHWPCSASYRGHLSEEEFNEIEKRGFEIKLVQPHMSGGGDWTIRYPDK